MYLKSAFVDVKRFELKFKEFENVPFSFFFEYRPTLEELAINEINILALEEPNEYFGNHDWALANKDKFSAILTWDDRLLKLCDNAELLIYGESWLDDDTDRITKLRNKKFEVSHLRGAKLNSYGHGLRYEIFNRQDEIDIPTKFHATVEPFKVFQDNINGKDFILGESMFSVIIENTCHNNYFTEKLTDCMLMKTIPIYWGCSNIEKYYNSAGMFLFRSADEAIHIINDLSPELYDVMSAYVEENYKKAFEYKNFITRIKNRLKDIFEYNNIIKE